MTRLQRAVPILAALAFVTGCAGGSARDVAATSGDDTGVTATVSSPADTTASTTKRGDDRATSDASSAGTTPTSPGSTVPTTVPNQSVAKPDPSATPPPPGPRPTEKQTPVQTGVAIEATLSATCLRPGQTQHISIATLPKSGVAYDAVYSDGRYGGTAHYYGGNEGGKTDEQGQWSSHWVIAPSAPAGPVRVDVVAATPQGSGYTTVWFEVARASGRCA